MSIHVENRRGALAAAPSAGGGATTSGPDVRALEDDQPEDLPVLTTERRLQRLAMVACDVGARFAREGFSHDPVEWMLAPHALFGGARAIEAVQEPEGFARATLLHGLAFGVDAAPDELETLLRDEAAIACDPLSNALSQAVAAELFTCVIEGGDPLDGRRLQAFCAIVASDEREARIRLRERYGDRLAASAFVQAGFDETGPAAQSLLSPALRRELCALAAEPSVAGIAVQIEQRFAA